MLLYPNITQLDLTGPQEVLTKVPGVEVNLHWKTLQPVTSASGLKLIPTHPLELASPIDLLCVPGGLGQIDLMTDSQVLEFLRRAGQQARYVTSVCTGSLLLAAAGLLQGYRATTHWMAMDELPLLGAIPIQDRVVVDRNRITGAGVTAGIDFAFALIAQLWGTHIARSIQLALEYDPQPPMQSGSPKSAPPEEVQRLLQGVQPLLEKRRTATSAAVANLANYCW
jgi:cyclohexyl-isocyanide hydratase